jgi:uncharacterized protein (TIGR02145 family)
MVRILDSNADTTIVPGNQSTNAGGVLKDTTTLPTTGGWSSPNIGATNNSVFSALPSGYRRDSDGSFIGRDQNTFFWSSTVISPTETEARGLAYNNAALYRGRNHPRTGFSVRCVKD